MSNDNLTPFTWDDIPDDLLDDPVALEAWMAENAALVDQLQTTFRPTARVVPGWLAEMLLRGSVDPDTLGRHWP